MNRSGDRRTTGSRCRSAVLPLCRSSFSLVELLVVIALILLLASLLLPALREARERGKRAVCLGNLRQVGIAALAYADDYGKFVTLPDLGFNWYPQGMAITTYGRYGGKAGTIYPSYPWFVVNGDRLLNRYVGFKGTATTTSRGAIEVFRCPSDTGLRSPSGLDIDIVPTMWDAEGMSYHWNADALNDDPALGLWGKHPADVRNAAGVVMACDGTFIAYHQAYLYGGPRRIGYWHDQRQFDWGNVLFVDGHVQYLRAYLANPTFQTGPGYTFIYNQ